MGKAPKPLLAFTDDFVRHMSEHRAWPGYRDIKMKMATYTELRRGVAAEASCARRVVRYILKADPDAACREMVNAFFERHRWPAPATLPFDEVVGRVCVAADGETPANGVGLGCLERGVGAMAEAFTNVESWQDYLQGCPTLQDVQDAMDWFFVDLGRMVAGDPLLPLNEARAVVEKLIGTSLANHQSRAIDWWDFNRWTVVTARRRYQPTAMSLCLPITPTTADLLLCGHLMPHECSPRHFELPASTVFLLMAAVRPRELDGDPGDSTVPLSVAIATQIAALTRPGKRRPKSIRLISIAGSQLNAIRLKSWGFTNCGVPVPPNQDIFYYSRTLTDSSRDNNDRMFMQILKMLWKDVCHSLPPPVYRKTRAMIGSSEPS